MMTLFFKGRASDECECGSKVNWGVGVVVEEEVLFVCWSLSGIHGLK